MCNYWCVRLHAQNTNCFKSTHILLPAVIASSYMQRLVTEQKANIASKKCYSNTNKPLPLCVTETRRLQTLSTTGGDISVACCYHVVSTNGRSYLFIACVKIQFSDDVFHCGLQSLKWMWKHKGQPGKCTRVIVCVQTPPHCCFTLQQTSQGTVAHLTSQVWNMQKARRGENYI